MDLADGEGSGARMASVDDVAAELLKLRGSMDTFKLQKLVYYCQAWHLIWEDAPLFDEPIEAWANGPVVPALFNKHRGRYRVDSWEWGNPHRLTDAETSTVKAVADFYGARSGHDLASLTHQEDPWRLTRERAGLGTGERGRAEISLAAMTEYYGSLV